MRLKRSKKSLRLRPFGVFMIALVLFVVATWLGLTFIDQKMKPVLMEMAQNEAEQAVMYAINYGLHDIKLEKLERAIDFNRDDIMEENKRFFLKTYDKEGRVTDINFDTAAIRAYQYEKTKRIQSFLQLVENGKISIEHGKERIIRINKKPIGVSASIPLGQVTETALFGSLGPNIPVHFELMSDVKTNVTPKIKETGINSVQIQLIIHVWVHVRIVMPFSTKPSILEQDIPITEDFYRGETPKYMNGNGGR